MFTPTTPEALYQQSFRRVHQLAVRLLRRAVPSRDAKLQAALRLAFKDQSPTEYPYLFRNCFLGRHPGPSVVDTLAAAVHLIQTSTFVTDDVFDAARQRNGNPTVCAHAGVNGAIVAAHILQSIGFSALATAARDARLPNAGEAVATLAEAVTHVYRGQYLDMLHSSRLSTSRADYYRVIDLTTASLFAAVSRCGALLGGGRPSEILAMSRFASCYGMALQITDDILDVTDESTGKTFGSDLKCRRMRLPLIIAMHKALPSDKATLRRFIKGGTRDARTIRMVARIIQRSGGVARALHVARRYRAQSLWSLAEVRPGPAKDALAWLPESLLAAQDLE